MQKMTRCYIYAFLSGLQFTITTWLAFVVARGGNPGWAEAAYHLAIVFGEVPTGAIADLMGRRTSMLVGMGMTVVTPFLYLTIEGTLTACLVLAISGLAATFLSGADNALIYETAEAEGGVELARKAMARVSMLRLIASAMAPAVAGLLYEWHIWAPMGAKAIVALLGFAVVWGMYETRQAPPAGERRSVWQQTAAAAAIVRANRPVLWMIIFAWVYNTFIAMTMQYGQAYFPSIGLTMGLAGFVFAAGNLIMSGGSWWAERLGGEVIRRMMRFGPVAVALGITLMGLGGPVAVAIGVGGYLLLCLLDGVIWPVWLAEFNERIPNEQRATLMSMQSMGFSVLMSVAFPAASYLQPVSSIYVVTGLVGLLMAAFWAMRQGEGRTALSTPNV